MKIVRKIESINVDQDDLTRGVMFKVYWLYKATLTLQINYIIV